MGERELRFGSRRFGLFDDCEQELRFHSARGVLPFLYPERALRGWRQQEYRVGFERALLQQDYG